MLVSMSLHLASCIQSMLPTGMNIESRNTVCPCGILRSSLIGQLHDGQPLVKSHADNRRTGRCGLDVSILLLRPMPNNVVKLVRPLLLHLCNDSMNVEALPVLDFYDMDLPIDDDVNVTRRRLVR